MFWSCNKCIERKQLDISKLFSIYGDKPGSLHHVCFCLPVMEMYLSISILDALGYFLLIYIPRKLLCYILEFLVFFGHVFLLFSEAWEMEDLLSILWCKRSRHQCFNIWFYLEKKIQVCIGILNLKSQL